MSPPVSLDDLRAAYRRTSSRIYRILEDGYDFSVEHLIVEALDRDALVIDAAHGERLTSGYNIADIFETAYHLEAILSGQFAQLESKGTEA